MYLYYSIMKQNLHYRLMDTFTKEEISDLKDYYKVLDLRKKYLSRKKTTFNSKNSLVAFSYIHNMFR